MLRIFWLLPLAVAMTAQESVTVTGTLNRVMAIGGETKGWALQPDDGFRVTGKLLNELEVAYPNQAKLREWNGKRVRVSGKLAKRSGVERGERTVLEISKIEGATAAAPLVRTKWLLEDLAGSGVIDNSQATLDFPTVTTASGSGSCNNFSGTVKVDGAVLTFGPFRTTRKACVEAVMRQEAQFLKALGEAEKWELQGDKLLLHVKGLEKPLRFGKR